MMPTRNGDSAWSTWRRRASSPARALAPLTSANAYGRAQKIALGTIAFDEIFNGLPAADRGKAVEEMHRNDRASRGRAPTPRQVRRASG
jgi:hypothetical protein